MFQKPLEGASSVSTDGTLLAMTGDSLLTRTLDWVADPGFSRVRDLLSSSDAAFTNLEVSLPRRPISPGTAFHGTRVAASSRVLDALSSLGFNLFSLANNHATDFGVKGLVDTISEFQQRGIAYAGAGETLDQARRPQYLETRGGRVALIAVTSSNARASLAADATGDDVGRPGVNPLRFTTTYRLDDTRFGSLNEIVTALGIPGAAASAKKRTGLLPYPDRNLHIAERPIGSILLDSALFERGPEPLVEQHVIEEDLAAMDRWIHEAKRQSDYVIVSVHCHEGPNNSWGTDQPPMFFRTAARQFIDRGAHVVVGHGPHRLRPIEVYRGAIIFYSLGNFLFTVESQIHMSRDIYEHLNVGQHATPADVLDVRGVADDGSPQAYRTEPSLWESVLVLCRMTGGELAEARLHPIVLGIDRSRTRSGYPVVASKPVARRILTDLARISFPFGTTIEIEESASGVVGSIKLH
jgi:poly-gamma-glutamate capsule biosynthesis protein CapA/YwtB (metallophosphatase superfamily)